MEFNIEKSNKNYIVQAIESGKVLGQATIYLEKTPQIEGKQVAAIGDFECENMDIAREILEKCEELIKKEEFKTIVAPMNGNTWNKYRCLSYTTEEPVFTLENVNKEEYNDVLLEKGYMDKYKYTSTKADLKDRYVSKGIGKIKEKLLKENITIRNFNKQEYIKDLKCVYQVASKCFTNNPLFTVAEEALFLEQYEKYLEYIDEELFLLVEKEGRVIGFNFCIPNYNQMKDIGKIDTVIVKTIAILPEYAKYGITALLSEKTAEAMEAKNYTKWIYAFMYENNKIQKNTNRNKTKVIRRYTLYQKEI